MSDHKSILVVTGDVGGARAMIPVLRELERRGAEFDLVDHGFIRDEASSSWRRVSLPPDGAGLVAKLKADYRGCVFGTSVSDTYPLGLARSARAAGLPVMCVLDNWGNYRRRLEMDGQAALVPECYAVMDKLAFEEALADGIPASCLRIVGHPGLASLPQEYGGYDVPAERQGLLQRAKWAGNDRKLIVFVSEPVANDQGVDGRSPQYRGYTEKVVLALLARCLQPFAESIQIGLVAHPREDAHALLAHWETCRGSLVGGMLAAKSGREAVFVADGVCGMASLLLYEAMLLAKPVLSLQPGMRLPQLAFLQKKGIPFFTSDEAAAPEVIGEWMGKVLASSSVVDACELDPEITIHHNAPALLADLIVGLSPNE